MITAYLYSEPGHVRPKILRQAKFSVEIGTMSTRKAETLFRPTGEHELALIRDGGWRAFPPRLPDQPFFYPVLIEDYATQIARDWNTKNGGMTSLLTLRKMPLVAW